MIHLLSQIPQRIAKTAPHKTAFRFEQQELTYQQLSEQANGLAHQLIAHGLQPGDRVALCLPKSLLMPVAVYGSLIAGGIYVPIDPQSPIERLVRIIEDADIHYLIVGNNQNNMVSALCTRLPRQVKLVVGPAEVAQLPATISKLVASDITQKTTPPILNLVEDDPAYMLYTSGSTGHPKGILHSHRSGLAYAKLAAHSYKVEASDRLGNFAPLHFDQSTFEFLAGPLVGATTVLIPPAFGIAVASLAELIEDEALTIWYSVPSVLVQMMAAGVLEEKQLGSLRWILFGGEVFPTNFLKKIQDFFPNAHLSNVYGPTEVNQCTIFNVSPNQQIPEPLPIGLAWDNTQLLIVDADDNPVARGQQGELLVRSPTMMLGYWQNPELNEKAFVLKQGHANEEIRYYRTGDLVVENTLGQLEILGRMDRQIKTRGFRVELDEVEQLLTTCPSTLEAAVFSVTTDAGVHIEAAVTVQNPSSDSRTTNPRTFLKFLKPYLPQYALPQTIHIVNELPRTRTGKIDRRALSMATQKSITQ